MATFAVEKRIIDEIKEHTNADKLELGTVEGMAFQFVVGKGVFKAGDEVVYFPIDSLLPQDLISFLDIGNFMSGKDRNRIKTVKLRGEISQGYVTTIQNIQNFLNKSELPFDVTDMLHVEKYEPPVKMTQGGSIVRLPEYVSVYDIEGADRYTQVIDFMMDKPVYISEKIEGMNFGVSIDADDKIHVNQRNHDINQIEGQVHSFWKVAHEEGLIEAVKKIKKDWRVDTVVLRGEFTGSGSQGDYYQLKKQTVYLFEIELDGRSVGAWDFRTILHNVGLEEKCVPTLFFNVHLKDCLDGKTIQEFSNGQSEVNPSKKREGVVIKLIEEDTETKLDGFRGRIFIKQRSPEYLAKTDN